MNSLPASKEEREFRLHFGVIGEAERRAFGLDYTSTKDSRAVPGSLEVAGHASVFSSPSVELVSHRGAFTEHIAPGAFTNVLRRLPDVILTWDHNSSLVLARTHEAGTLELSADDRGLRFFARMSDTSYARDLQVLMRDKVVTQASFMFRVAPGGESWSVNERTGGVERTISEVGDLYDVCVAAQGAYPAADSGLVRSVAVAYALDRGLLSQDPAVANRVALIQRKLEVQRRRLTASTS